MNRRNKYIPLLLTLLAVSAAAFWSAERSAPCCYEKTIHPDHGMRYTDAAIAHRFHQNHINRYRIHLDGCSPVQQDTMLPIVAGVYSVAPVKHLFYTTPVRPSLRGPPMVA